MADFVIARNPTTAREEYRPAYFDLPPVLTPQMEWITPRFASDQARSVWVWEGGGSLICRSVDWQHRIQSPADVGNQQFTSTTIGRYTNPGMATIKGVTPVIGDRVEVSQSAGRSFEPDIPAGIYRITSLNPPTLRLADPPIYTLSGPSDIGGAVYYRKHPTIADGLEGLANAPQTAKQYVQQGSTAVVNAHRIIDGDENSSADMLSLNSSQGVHIEIEPIDNVYAFVFTAGAFRQPNDVGVKYAQFNLAYFTDAGFQGQNNFHWKSNTYYADTLTNAFTNTWASSAAARSTYYHVPTTVPTKIAGWRVIDSGNSRALVHRAWPIVSGRQCQIRLPGGVIPEAGSIIKISKAVGDLFLPKIPEGNYPVEVNDNSGPWRLGAPIALLSPIGQATEDALFVDSAPWVLGSTGMIDFVCGTLYQLRVNEATQATSAIYYLQHQGQAVTELGRSTDARNNFSIDYTPTVQQYEDSLSTPAQIWVEVDGIDQPRRFDCQVIYRQIGRVTPANGDAYFPGDDFDISVIPDLDRAYRAGVYDVIDTTTAIAIESGVIPTPANTIRLTLPPTGVYDVSVRLSYSTDGRPNERFMSRITVN